MAGHLVRPPTVPVEISTLRDELEVALRFLVAAGRATVPLIDRLPDKNWGSATKRAYVKLAREGRPALVGDAADHHSFAEVVNQCATLERLIDALRWAEHAPELQGAKVVGCNPTTSSAPVREEGGKDHTDHDLVLVDRGGAHWKFEVSDVASDRDGNGKEKKDLASLGIPTSDEPHAWPSGRCFRVVSEEFAKRLRKPTRHGLRLGLFHYVDHTNGEAERMSDETTRIFEVRPGRP